MFCREEVLLFNYLWQLYADCDEALLGILQAADTQYWRLKYMSMINNMQGELQIISPHGTKEQRPCRVCTNRARVNEVESAAETAAHRVETAESVL